MHALPVFAITSNVSIKCNTCLIPYSLPRNIMRYWKNFPVMQMFRTSLNVHVRISQSPLQIYQKNNKLKDSLQQGVRRHRRWLYFRNFALVLKSP